MNILELSDRMVDDIARLSPIAATAMGIPGYDHLWQDFSPAGAAGGAELLRGYLRQADDLGSGADDWEELARRTLIDFASQTLDEYEHGDHLRDINNTASPLQSIVQVFDLMDTATDEGVEAVISRMMTLGDVLDGYREALISGMEAGLTAARRQVASAVDECRAHAADGSFLNALAQRVGSRRPDRVSRAAASGRTAFGRLADFLESTYQPVAADRDAVGAERYLRAARRFLGSEIDPEETYRWGWEEVKSIWARMQQVAGRIRPDSSVREALAVLKTDPTRCVPDVGEFLDFVAGRQEDAVARLAGVHFEIPDAMRQVDVKLAPAGSALGAYYHQPSEDFSRPGAVFYALADRRPIPVYDEVSTAYHEGFPGHHLQVGIQVGLAERLSRLHRMVVWYPGYGEGWALYVEQLMDELGFYEKPDYVMGLLVNQMHRACRVVIDIGSHLEFEIPVDSGFHPGESWTYELAVELLEERAFLEPAYARSEVTRYLGWPGQAIAYKVGERAILDLRTELQRREGDRFDLKAFHARVLGFGPVGLDHLTDLVLG